jgi:hypothetical protein
MATVDRVQSRVSGGAASRLSWIRRILTSLGGAQSSILAQALVDAPEMTGRGIAALIPAVSGAVAGCVTLRDAYRLPLAAGVAVGVAWGLVLLFFDLSLMSAAADRSPLSRLVTFGSRAVVSVLFALTIASSLVLALYNTDVVTRMRADQEADLGAYNSRYIVPRYQPLIDSDQRQINVDQEEIRSADKAVVMDSAQTATAQLQATCEAGGINAQFGCGQGTGRAGEGPVYHIRLQELSNDEARLRAAEQDEAAVDGALAPQVAALNADIKATQREQQVAYAAAEARYLADDGLIARWRALGELEQSYPAVRAEVWLFEALIIAIDLSAVLAKLSSRTPSYDRVVRAERTRIQLQQVGAEEDAADDIDTRRAERAAIADVHAATLDAYVELSTARLRAYLDVELHRVGEWARGATGDTTYRAASSPGSWRQPTGTGRERTGQDSRVEAPSLSQFVAASQDHEQQPVRMAAPLAWAAWVGVVSLSAVVIATLALHALHVSAAGEGLAALALVGSVGLAIYSRGFRRGPTWAHQAAFGVAVLGLAMPAVVAALSI